MDVKFGSYEPIFLPPAEKIAHVRQMEKQGFDSVWAGDHLMELNPNIRASDVFCWLSTFALNTKKLQLGTCVTDPHRRNPAVLAQSIFTVNKISNGRAILGIGPGEAMNVDPFGIPWDRPVSRLEESVRLVRMLGTGEEISFKGSHYTFEGAYLAMVRGDPELQRMKLPIYVAANSPASRKLVGTLADGWITLATSPDLYRKDLEEIRSFARMAKRPAGAIEPALAVSIAMSKDRDEAMKLLSTPSRFLLLCFPRQLERLGGGEATDEFNWLRLRVRKGTYDAILKRLEELPLELALKTCIYGDAEDCIEGISRFIKAGVRHFIFSPQGSPKAFCKEFAEKVLPYFAESRRTAR